MDTGATTTSGCILTKKKQEMVKTRLFISVTNAKHVRSLLGEGHNRVAIRLAFSEAAFTQKGHCKATFRVAFHGVTFIMLAFNIVMFTR